MIHWSGTSTPKPMAKYFDTFQPATVAALILGLALQASAADMHTGPVKRGTKVPELKAQLGEPKSVKASEGDGARVEKWYYDNGVIVVVQDGFVLDSFVEKKP